MYEFTTNDGLETCPTNNFVDNLHISQQFSLWQNLCSKGNKGIEEMVSSINRIIGKTGIPACPVADDRQECLSYRLISISSPYPFYHNENCYMNTPSTLVLIVAVPCVPLMPSFYSVTAC